MFIFTFSSISQMGEQLQVDKASGPLGWLYLLEVLLQFV